MREAGLSAKHLKPLDASKTKRLPIARSEVDRLVKVEAMVEAGVVCLRKRDDELSCALIHGVHSNASFLQLLRSQESDQLEEKVGLGLEELRHSFAHGGLEFLRVFTRDAVPCLGSTKVLIVGGVGVVVLVVPAESREDHANINPWHSHAGDV